MIRFFIQIKTYIAMAIAYLSVSLIKLVFISSLWLLLHVLKQSIPDKFWERTTKQDVSYWMSLNAQDMRVIGNFVQVISN